MRRVAVGHEIAPTQAGRPPQRVASRRRRAARTTGATWAGPRRAAEQARLV
jgi:hypothetical protein